MAYIVYTSRRKLSENVHTKIPAIRFSQSSIVLNKWAREALGGSTSIELAFNPDDKTIRISPNGNVKLKKTKFYAKGFFRRFNLSNAFVKEISRTPWPAEVRDGKLYVKIG